MSRAGGVRRGSSAGADATSRPGRAGREPVQRAGSRGGDVEMRLQAAIRIDFVRGKGKHRPLDVCVRQPFERGQKEPRVDGHPLDLGVVRDDEHRRQRATRPRPRTSPWPAR